MVEVKPLKILSDYDLKHELARSFFPPSFSPPPPPTFFASFFPSPSYHFSLVCFSVTLPISLFPSYSFPPISAGVCKWISLLIIAQMMHTFLPWKWKVKKFRMEMAVSFKRFFFLLFPCPHGIRKTRKWTKLFLANKSYSSGLICFFSHFNSCTLDVSLLCWSLR